MITGRLHMLMLPPDLAIEMRNMPCRARQSVFSPLHIALGDEPFQGQKTKQEIDILYHLLFRLWQRNRALIQGTISCSDDSFMKFRGENESSH